VSTVLASKVPYIETPRAHEEAYKYGVLHRDISDNNVRITANGDGILTDWDLAIRVKTPHGQLIEPTKARQRYRTVSTP